MGENIVVINGKRFDARTGRLLATTQHTQAKHNPVQSGVVLDGFTRKPTVQKAVTPAHGVHRKAEKSKTLMRGAVKKPVTSKVHAKAQTIANHAKPATSHKTEYRDANRTARAATVSKSSLISRFGASLGTTQHASTATSLAKTIAKVPVKQAPPISGHHSAPLPVHITNPFATAIENAGSHKELRHKKTTRRQRVARKLRMSTRTLSAGSMVLAGLLLGGFFMYQSIPTLAVRVAAARSGVPAQLPGYKPAGFAMNGPITYSAGKISINYRSTTDDRNFAITQSTSEWNDEALLDNFVTAERRAYQTYQDKGKTIYIYGDDNATWIEDGVWYQVEGASSLNSDQLLRIANSL